MSNIQTRTYTCSVLEGKFCRGQRKVDLTLTNSRRHFVGQRRQTRPDNKNNAQVYWFTFFPRSVRFRYVPDFIPVFVYSNKNHRR